MTQEQLTDILTKQPAEIVKELQISNIVVPKWTDLEKQYDPMLHNIWDEAKYPKKTNTNSEDDFKRTALGLQELAVNRISQSMFSAPVQRIYNFDNESEKEQNAVDIIEELYETRNNINSENIERAKSLNKSCQVCTVWFVREKQTIINKEVSKYKLSHKSYSEPDGYKLYPNTDEYGDLLVMSMGYKDSSDVEYFDVFTNEETPKYIRYKKAGSGWVIEEGFPKVLEVFSVIYSSLKSPVWGGDAGTNLVEQLEEMESYDGMYIKRNSLPTFTLDYGETNGAVQITENEESTDNVRNIIRVGKGGGLKDATWPGAKESLTNRFNRIRNAYFEQIQVPDTSFANMISSNTSAENKELIFADAKAKAKDLGGEWEKLFFDELEIVKGYAKVMFPSYSAEFDNISVRSIIQPYSIRTKKESAEYIATGGQAMSLATQVSILGEVDDINQEVEQIENEKGTEFNQL